MIRKGNRRRRRAAPKPMRRWPRLKLGLKALLLPPAGAAVLLAGAWAAQGLLDQPLKTLVVEGSFQRVTPLEIEAAVAPELARGFLSIDLRALRRKVQALDWVDEVKIARRWPDTLVVRVVEHQAAARWGERGLLNVRGELFTVDARHTFPELPQLAGPEGSEREVASRYLAVRGRLMEAGLGLRALAMDERGAWVLQLASGQEIRLGRLDVDQRLDRFFEVVAPSMASDLDRVAYIDMRYTNGFAVGWIAPEGTSLAQAEGDRARG